MSGIVERLTEGVVNRDMRAEGHALLEKWERTGLLEGLGNDRTKHGMARLLENQAKELLREATAMASGDVEGFAAVAFPIVRRVFAGLIANDLVSVQPMSLPSGLIFFLDFLTSADAGDNGGSGLPRLGYGSTAESLYGGGVVGAALTGGVSLTGDNAEAGPYALNNGYLGDFETFDFNERYSNPTIPTAQRDYDIYGNKLEEFTPQGPFSRALGFVKDKAAPIFGGIASVATGIPFIGPALEGFESRFANRQLGAPVIDEFGNVYDEEELNKMNALGGYYTEAARSARRRCFRFSQVFFWRRI